MHPTSWPTGAKKPKTRKASLPKGVALLNFFDAISVRAAVDSLSPLNERGAAQHEVKDYDDFFAQVNSPFRQ
jgi:hypothetical protein